MLADLCVGAMHLLINVPAALAMSSEEKANL